MDQRAPSRRRSSINENESVFDCKGNKGKRKLEDLDHIVEPVKRYCRRISIREQKLLKLHGIKSDARVKLQKLNPLDIRNFSQKYKSECKNSGSSDNNKIDSELKSKANSFEGFENKNQSSNFSNLKIELKPVKIILNNPKILTDLIDSSKNSVKLRDSAVVNSNKNLDATDKATVKLRDSAVVNSNKNIDVTDKAKLVSDKIVTEKQINLKDEVRVNSVCNKDSPKEDLRNIRNNSFLDYSKKGSNEKTIGVNSEDHSAAIKLIEERLKSIKKNPLALKDINVSGNNLNNDNSKVTPLTGVNHTKVNSLKEDSVASLMSSSSLADAREDLKSVRLNSIQDKQEKDKNTAIPKPLIILGVDEINKSVSTENKESSKANIINCNEKNLAVSDKLDGLNFKPPPPVREFTLKDFGLDGSSEKDAPSTSKTINDNVDKYFKDKLSATSKTINNNVDVDKYFKEKIPIVSNTLKNDIDKYLKEKLAAVQNDPLSDDPKSGQVPVSVSVPVPVSKSSQEEKIKKYSLEELGLSNRKVRTLGLKDFTEPNSLVFGVGDFKVKPPNGGSFSNLQDDLRKSLRNFRLDNLRDVKVKSKGTAVPDTNINNKSSNDTLNSFRKEETSGKVVGSKTETTNEGLVSQTAAGLISEGSNKTSTENVEVVVECSSGKKMETNDLNGIVNESSLCPKDDENVLDNKRTSTTNCTNKEVESVSKRTDSNDLIMIDLIENHDENASTIDNLNSKSASIDNVKSRKELDSCDSQSEADKNNLSSVQKLPSCDNSISEVETNTDCLNNTVRMDDNLNKLTTGNNASNSSTDIELNGNASKSQMETILESSTTHIALLNTGCLSAQKEVSSSDVSKDSMNNSGKVSESNQNTQNCEAEIVALDVIANSGERAGEKKETDMNNEAATYVNIEEKNSPNTKSDVNNLNRCADVTIVEKMNSSNTKSDVNNLNKCTDVTIVEKLNSSNTKSDVNNLNSSADVTTVEEMNSSNTKSDVNNLNRCADVTIVEKLNSSNTKSDINNLNRCADVTIVEEMNTSNTKSDVNNLNRCADVTIEAVSVIKNLSADSNQRENNMAGAKVSEVSKNEVRTVFNGPNNVLPNIRPKSIIPNFPFMLLSLGGMASQNTAQIHKATSVVRNCTDIRRASNNVLNQEDRNIDRNYDEVLCDVEVHEESFPDACDFDNGYDDDDDIIEIIEPQDLNSGKNNGNSSGIKPSNENANIDKDLEIILDNQVKKTTDNQVNLIEKKQNLTSSNKKSENKNEDLCHIVKRLKSNDYNIKNLFLSSKKNTPKFPPKNLSNRNRHSNKLKENSKFGKEERIEDCSYDYPKFSVLDTEGLIHSYRNLVCGSCFKHVDVKFASTMSSSGTEFEVECFSCNHIRRFKRSKSCVNEVDFSVSGYDNLYLKLVYSCLDFGGGYRQLQSTCLALNIPHLNKKSYEMYSSYIINQAEVKLNTVLNATSEIVHNAYENQGISASAEGIREIDILMDSWIPKGKKDKYLLVVAVDLLTGLVLDFYLIINYCRNCCIMRKKKNFESWKLKHKSLGQCHINWNSHENNMESEARHILSSRSEQKYKLKYSTTSNVLSRKTNFNSVKSQTATEENCTVKNAATCDLNLSDTVEKNEMNINNIESISNIESDITSSTLKPKEMASNISPISEIYSKTELSNLESSPHNDKKSVLNSSTPVKVSIDSCDSNGALEIQSTSSQLTLTNINSISNSDSDKELQEFNKSPNHVLEEINIDLNLDLDNLVPSVTSSDTLSEGLLEGNGVLVHGDGLSLTDNEPLSIGAINNLGNQCINEEMANAGISKTSPVSKILMVNVQNVSDNNKELSNMIPEVISDKKEASSVLQKSANENSMLNISKKVMHDDSTTVSKQLASIVDVNKELINKEVGLSVQSVSESKKELSNIVPETISDKNNTSSAFQKSDNVNSVLNINEKITHDDDSIIASKQLTSIVNVNEELDNKEVTKQTTSTNNNPIPQSPLKVDSVVVGPILITNEKQDEDLVSNDKLNNSLTYDDDEHREMASLLASNVVDQDASTDFEKSVSKENIVPDLKDNNDNLEQDISVRNKDLNGLLNEESREICTINEVELMEVDASTDFEKSVSEEIIVPDLKDNDNLKQDVSVPNKDLNGLLNKNSREIFTINEVELMEVDESVNEKSDNLSNMSILNKDSEDIQSVGKENETKAAAKAGSISENTACSSETKNTQNEVKDVPSSVEEDKTITLSDNINVRTVDNSAKESFNNLEKVRKMLQRAKKESLRSSILKCCNSSAPITKELIEFACSQAIISHNINIQNLSIDCSNST